MPGSHIEKAAFVPKQSSAQQEACLTASASLPLGDRQQGSQIQVYHVESSSSHSSRTLTSYSSHSFENSSSSIATVPIACFDFRRINTPLGPGPPGADTLKAPSTCYLIRTAPPTNHLPTPFYTTAVMLASPTTPAPSLLALLRFLLAVSYSSRTCIAWQAPKLHDSSSEAASRGFSHTV